MRIPNHIYQKLQSQAEETAMMNEDYLSDMDYAYNPVTEKFDIPAIEWDGPMGKHWEKFDTEAERTACLKKREERIEKATTAELKKLTDKWYAERNKTLRSKPTLGNLCPDAFKKLLIL